MNRIFKWLTKEGNPETGKAYTSWFSRSFNPKDFTGIDQLLVCFLVFCGKLQVCPSKQFLQAYLTTDAKTDIKKYNIKVDTMNALDYREASQLEEAVDIMKETALATYDDYLTEELQDRDFKVDVYSYFNDAKSNAIQNAILSMYPKLTDGSSISDVSSGMRNKLVEIEETYDVGKIKEIDDESDEAKMDFICKTTIPCIDGDIGGIYTRLITTINGQPAGGKSRFAFIYYAYQVMTQAKKDVMIYSTELTATQVKNIMIAYHILMLYDRKYKIADTIMNRYDEMSEDQKKIYEAAKIDLFESGNYGHLTIKEDCVVERLEDEVRAEHSLRDDLKLIVIDYMGLLQSNPTDKYAKSKDVYEIITDGYIIVRKLVKTLNMHAVCINQYNDKGIDAAYAGKPIRSGYVQGGHISNRHTDYDLSITYTEEQKIGNYRALSVSKTRGTRGFANILFAVDLAVSEFRQEQLG